jgi:hypothetical protein
VRDNRAERPRERSGGPRPVPIRRNADEDALALRDSGKSFAAVARGAGFKRALDAHAGFLRALGRRQGEERANLAQRELARLDELETRIRTRDADDVAKMERRLAAVDKMRKLLV